MKKTVLLLLTLVFCVSVFAACNTVNHAKPDNLIGEERAKEIALENAGVSADDVNYFNVELDHDGSIWKYEIDFRCGRTEYEADIKADDGKIIAFESDFND